MFWHHLNHHSATLTFTFGCYMLHCEWIVQRSVSLFIVGWVPPPRRGRKLTYQREGFPSFLLFLCSLIKVALLFLKMSLLSEKKLIYIGLANIFIDCYIEETCFHHLMDLWAFASLLPVTGNQLVSRKHNL